MSARLKIKRGTTTSWADSANKDTTLEPGQLGVEYLTDGNMRLKVGKQTDNGSATDWSSLPYVTPPTSVYQDSEIKFTKSSGSSSFRIIGKLSNQGRISTTTDESSNSSIMLTASSKLSSTSGSVMISCYCNDGAPSFYGSPTTRLGYPNSPWIKGYITDTYTDSTTYSNSMKVAYNSETEALEFISL